MTQVIACSTKEGIVLATDSQATWFDPLGHKRHFSLKKIIPLSSHAALISAGEGVGVGMGLTLQRVLHQQKAESIEEVVRVSTPFLMEAHEHWVGRRDGVSPPSSPTSKDPPEDEHPLKGVYFILGGYSRTNQSDPFPLHLLGSEGEGLPLKPIPAPPILLIPRSMSMERRLEALCRQSASPDSLLPVCKSFLRKRSEEEDVGPPYYFATITAVGYREIREEEVRE